MKRAVGGRAKGARALERERPRSRRTSSSPPLQTTVGAVAAATWLRSLKLRGSKQWYVELAIDSSERPVSITFSHENDTRFHLNIYPEEWGVFFCHGSRASWIRVTDEPFVHGRDDFGLLGDLPELHQISYLVRALEERFGITFSREHALVRTNVMSGQKSIRDWLAAL